MEDYAPSSYSRTQVTSVSWYCHLQYLRSLWNGKSENGVLSVEDFYAPDLEAGWITFCTHFIFPELSHMVPACQQGAQGVLPRCVPRKKRRKGVLVKSGSLFHRRPPEEGLPDWHCTYDQDLQRWYMHKFNPPEKLN